MSILLISGIIITFILSLIYIALQRKFNYWSKKKVPHLKPKPILGNYGDYLLMRKSYGHVAQDICKVFPNEPYVGAYFGTEPTLIIQDPEIIKLVTTKDFYYFNSREVMEHIGRETINGNNLFFTFGDKWKVTRQHMTPLFTSAKMKKMYHLIEKCSHVFEDLLDAETKTTNLLEMRSLIGRYTMDCVCSCGFGVETNTMTNAVSNNPFVKMGQQIFEISNARSLSMKGRSIWPRLFFALGLQVFPKDIAAFFHELLTGLFKSRQYTPSGRNDFVDLILEWTKKGYLTTDSFTSPKTNVTRKVTVKVDDNFLVSQSIVFFAAGYESSAATLSFALYELAKHTGAQKRAMEDVDTYLKKNNNKLDYNIVTDLPFLQACLDETLRLYPVLSVLTREVVEDYTLPSGLHLDKGIRIHLPVYHMHQNPNFFPEPQKFIPERFLPEEGHKIKPYTYMPFGEGHRICIGKRFAKMQALSGLITILKKYKMELAEGMPEKLEFEPRSFVTLSKSGIHLKLVVREGWEQREYNREGVIVY